MPGFERVPDVGDDEYLKADLLPPALRYQLSLVVPSLRGKVLPQYPALLRFTDGRVVERALLIDSVIAYRMTRLWTAPLETYVSSSLLGLASIEESPWRLPPRWANFIYEHEEASMGSYEFDLTGEEATVTIRPGGVVDYPDLGDKEFLGSIRSVGVAARSTASSSALYGSASYETFAFRRL